MATSTMTAERARPGLATSIAAVVRMARPDHLALIVLIFVNGVLLGAWRGAGGDSLLAAASDLLPAALLLVAAGAAVHLANEAIDHETDRLGRRTRFSGGSGALQASGLAPRVPLTIGLAVAAVVVVAAGLAVATSLLTPVAAAILVAGLAGGLAYSLPPVAAMRNGWGEPLNAFLGGLLLPLYGVAALTSGFGSLDVIAFLPFTFVVLLSVLATAWPDRGADALTGKRTLQVRLDPDVLRTVADLAFLGFLGATVAAIFTMAIPGIGAGLLVLPLLVVGLRRYTRREDPSVNVVAMVAHAAITLLMLLTALGMQGQPSAG